MKYLDYPALNNLSASLSTSPAPETKINVRFEAYSVKPIRGEKKMFKEMEEAYMSGQEEMEEMSFSPEMKEAGLSSCFGRLDEKESRKVHFLLVSTLNAAFPDHDFSSLRPDHFTREPNAAVVFGHLSGTLSGQGAVMGPPTSSPLLRPLGSSPSGPAHFPFKPQDHRALSEVIDLEECEVYSWFPSPEYDPHAEAEEGELSEDEEILDESLEMDLDENETEASWGQAGMEMEVEPVLGGGVMETRQRRKSKGGPMEAPPMLHKRSSEDDGLGRRGGGLLWSTNYFFYSKRQKRVLFLTCWCRKRSPFLLSPNPTETAFPAPISASSFTPPSHTSLLAARTRFRPRPKPTSRLHKKTSHSHLTPSKVSSVRGESEVDTSLLIPIRGMDQSRSTPAPAPRLASSAPAQASGFLMSPSGQGALAKMTAGGFRPGKPTARTMINAARLSDVGLPEPKVETAEDRIRKERSESSQSTGPGRVIVGAEGDGKGKRLRL